MGDGGNGPGDGDFITHAEFAAYVAQHDARWSGFVRALWVAVSQIRAWIAKFAPEAVR